MKICPICGHVGSPLLGVCVNCGSKITPSVFTGEGGFFLKKREKLTINDIPDAVDILSKSEINKALDNYLEKVLANILHYFNKLQNPFLKKQTRTRVERKSFWGSNSEDIISKKLLTHFIYFEFNALTEHVFPKTIWDKLESLLVRNLNSVIREKSMRVFEIGLFAGSYKNGYLNRFTRNSTITYDKVYGYSGRIVLEDVIWSGKQMDIYHFGSVQNVSLDNEHEDAPRVGISQSNSTSNVKGCVVIEPET